jgi:hypothetical protein
VTDTRLAIRRVLRSMRRRIRCDHNRRNRGFLVPASTRDTRPHIRVSNAATPRSCAAHRVARYPRRKSETQSLEIGAPRGQA